MKKCIKCGKKFNLEMEEGEFISLFDIHFPGWIDGVGYYGYQDNGPLCASCVIDRIREEDDYDVEDEDDEYDEDEGEIYNDEFDDYD